MKAIILAAGRGMRMRPLTDTRPKPLLKVGQYTLIEHQINKLVKAGITEIIINHAWLGEQIVNFIGNGHKYGAKICYSKEDPALETAGGIAKALNFFNGSTFLAINSDIWTDWDASQAFELAASLDKQRLAQLILVENPAHNPDGDFQLLKSGLLTSKQGVASSYTFAGIGIYRPILFSKLDPDQAMPLAPLLRQAMVQKNIYGVLHQGLWFDIGTPERLSLLNNNLVI